MSFGVLDQSSSLDNLYEEAKIYFDKEQYSESLKLSLEAFEQSKTIKSINYMFLFSELIGSIYDRTFESTKAIYYYKKSLNYQSLINYQNLDNINFSSNIKSIISKIYLNLNSNYLKRYQNIKFQETNLNFDEKDKKQLLSKFKDSAQFYFNKLDKMKGINDEIQKYKGISYINLSALYFIDSIYNKAEYFAKKAVEIQKKRNDKKKIASALNNLGSIYIDDNKFGKAKKTYTDAIQTIIEDNSFEAVKFKITLYSNLAWAMRNLGEVEAYDNLEISYTLNDNLNEREFNEIIKKIETESNENITKLEHEKDIKIATIKKQSTTYLLIGLSVLILTISTIIIYNYKLRQRTLQLLLTKNKLLEEQNLDRLRSESQAKILNATIDGKESERKNIAETLHDSVSALLSSANMHITATKKQFNGNIPNELEKTQSIILEASKTVRDLSHNLVSSILLKFGLEYATKDIAKKYSNSEIKFHTEISNIGRYDQDIEIKIYNVIQELVNNIIKHSAANNAHIVLKEADNRISLLVEDDGIGFNYKQNKINSGIGLNQLEARIQVMKGDFTIESSNNKGTKISISIPAPKRFKFDFAHLTQ
ncbi:tetratricopeptide repeat-containing sensor histidine kinase [Tenacibaculum sp. SG-28]|uniref:tetratricopeptide repeat-containing sensor histidine kinase n=1 Tax=Tenacibaculum sp. SG-28 TaxID=754426 RepID=UPI000CF43AFC|nr:tetratricopeptide repeat-containing sensor histidine kinase [Tenacibaculum sp. SG-28]PQJ21048.1 hypothetical protein BSU00_08485 [Tenacibaculum sp. SG-28]